ncbi:MAG: YgiQ family radical SAM protein, partial [bacterium]|nr:YgiQ family radical SAM protein [bacterium]
AARALPTSLEEMAQFGWTELDFLLITGDAYVDHPTFGSALIGRVLWSAGYKIGIIAQPDWRDLKSFAVLGRPKLAVLISAGNLDSMISNYTASGKPRREDDFSPSSIGGKRPDRATIVYSNKIREVFKGIPIILGGIEASLRRFAHYDYWSDSVRRSILVDSKADALVFGMGEFPILEVAHRLNSGVFDFSHIRGVCYLADKLQDNMKLLPSYEEVSSSKIAYNSSFKQTYLEQQSNSQKVMAQKHGDRFVVYNPPSASLTVEQMDWIYAIPFTRKAHLKYSPDGIKALEEVEFSITSHRGCFGNCSFCALSAHQGSIIQRRSVESVVAEARLLIGLQNFKGYIHDVGGPTANFHIPACDKQQNAGQCSGKSCLSPKACAKLQVGHQKYLAMLREVRALPGVKKVFIRSGIRYDYVILDKDQSFINELCQHHISGQLKIA